MKDLLDGLVRTEDIAWAAELMGLGPDAFDPVGDDDSRQRVITSLETADFEAGPGSGKTTLLVAKLAVIARRWPHRQRGVCVLSHTNAARREIGTRLAGSAAGLSLLRYPHFIGTIHSFANEFLAMPWLRSLGYPVRTIDTTLVLRRRLASLDWSMRNTLQMRGLDEKALSYSQTDFTGGARGSLKPATPTYQRLTAAARASSEKGDFCFDEMFVWANDFLDKRPEAALDLRMRFPLLFIDEAQDNDEAQSALLHRIFCAGEAPSRRQRFGDSNQAIYSYAGQDAAASTDRFPSETKHDIPRSYRFCQAHADLVKGFGVAPQALVGAGPSRARVGADPKQPAIFLFDDDNVQGVLPEFGAYLVECFDDKQLASGAFVAVAGVHTLKEGGPVPHAMGHYAPAYDPATAKETDPATFMQCLDRARLVSASANDAYPFVDAAASALLTLSGLLGEPQPLFGRKSAHRRVLDALGEHPARAQYLALLDLIVTARGALADDQWTTIVTAQIKAVAEALAGSSSWGSRAEGFLQSSAPDTAGSDPGALTRSPNVYAHPVDAPKVQIRLGSIHAVKGETHTATLVLDSYYHKHHLSELKPWLLGERAGGSIARPKGPPKSEGSRMLGRLKLHYVAMTRPTHLLCLAMRSDAFVVGELETLRAKGWRLVRCPTAASPVSPT